MRAITLSVAALGAFAAPSVAQTVVRQFDASFTTPGVWYESFVTAAGDAATVDLTGLGGTLEANQPLPIGACRLTTTTDNADRANVGVADAYGQLGNIIATLELGYSSFKASNPGQNLAAAPALKLTISDVGCNDPASAGDCFGTLVFEPTWNQPGSEGSSVNPPLDVWQTWNIDGDNGLFWWTGGFGQPNTAGGPPLRTLNQWLGVMSTDFVTAEILQIEIGVGSFNQLQLGYFDDVTIEHAFASGYAAAYDFEPFFDCNGNGVHDPDDVTGGSSADCNGNGIPDECDIASGTSVDCQPNGVPDECEANVATVVNFFGPPETVPGSTPLGEWFEIFVTSNGAATTVDLTGAGGALEGGQPAPVGAALLTTTSDNNDRANVGYRDDFGGTMPEIMTSMLLGYSTFKASNPGQAAAPAPTLKLEVFNPGCGVGVDCYGTLVFEPYWNQPGSEGVSTNPPLDVWQDWAITPDHGLFWWTGGFGEPSGGGGPPLRTLSEWATVLGASPDFAGAQLISVQVGVGSFNQNQVGYFDSVRVQHTFGAAYSSCFDFEPITDCNGNGVHDPVDLAEGTSQDCNGNTIPDECDIADLTSDDCDGGGVPDECEPGVATIYGSGLNPAGSLSVLSGTAAIGTTLIVGIDNPLGTQGAGSLPFLFVSTDPDPNFPAGTPIPNLGMTAPGSFGELLIDVFPPNPLSPVLSGGLWTMPGTPVSVTVLLPNDCTLVGQDYYAQGLLIDPAAPPGVRFGLTDAVELVIGY